ncbi:MAG: single-stranded-DNA-specific exonuclease RecJ [Kiritimatiellia bacterium]|nr:single-stranded-DNA-specific exonuclease RecJ [Kiritimatiellia bacterium]
MKIWKTKSADADFTAQLAAELRLPPLLARVLSGYGFGNLESAAKFLNPKLKDVSDPFLIPQMEAAVLRIWRAVETKENILVYGDYDVDGIAGTVLLVQVLRRLGAGGVVPALPDRLNEGYGFSIAALQRSLAQTKPGLIITVDCGITAVESAEYVKKKGIDLIVTDHHEPGKSLPPAVAIVNPKLGAAESLKILAGVGVAFKLCHALLKHGKMKGFPSADFDLKEYLDLVALGTVADVVPLLDENRIFVRHGLAKLNSSDSPAWRALKEVAALNGCLDTYHLAFRIAPRLNAAGRLDTAETALELFLTEDENRAKVIARKLDEANRERQVIEAKILEEAIAEIDDYFKPDIHYGIVVGRRSWHVGVIGIVASRLAGKYLRPVIVIGFDESGNGRGSARSIAGYNILDGLSVCQNLLTAWGGHAMAAGMELNEKNYMQFKRLFNQAAEGELKGKNLAPALAVNAWIKLADISDENFKALERLAPFGQNNLKPVFAARGVKISAPPRVVGKNHLRFTVSEGKNRLNAIAFNLAGQKVPEGLVDIAFHIKMNSFNGAENLELNVLDYRKTSPVD